jgi:hypothetical protein
LIHCEKAQRGLRCFDYTQDRCAQDEIKMVCGAHPTLGLNEYRIRYRRTFGIEQGISNDEVKNVWTEGITNIEQGISNDEVIFLNPLDCLHKSD